MENIKRTVRVLLPLPLADAYDYSVPEGLEVAPGHFVSCRWASARPWAWCGAKARAKSRRRNCATSRRCCRPCRWPIALRRFVDWVSAYTLAPPGAVLRMAMSVPSALEAPKTEIVYRAAAPTVEGRRRGAEAHQRAPPRAGAVEGRAGAAGAGAGASRRCRHVGDQDHGVDRPARRHRAHDAALLRPARRQRQGPELSPEQALAAQGLVDKVLAHAFSATLLDGVPGRGKTEVYFEAIAAALGAGRQVLVLLPEIALTAQLLRTLRGPLRRHAGVVAFRPAPAWSGARPGAPSPRAGVGVVVGARSALFLPFADLGLIVVDEEHDGSFKQEDGVRYNARDMAVVRARLAARRSCSPRRRRRWRACVNVENGRYGAVHLPDRHGGAALPDVVGRRSQTPAAGARPLAVAAAGRGDAARPSRPASRRCCSSIAAAMRR